MEFNFLAIIVAAAVTLPIGFVWYHPKVFGTIWMKEARLTEEQLRGANMIVLFATSIFYAFLISFVLQFFVIHQFGAIGMIGGDPSKALPSYAAFTADYGIAFRSFKHGALHGFMAGLLFAFPVIGVGSLYERRSFKYVLIAGGYWVVSCTIMGGILCGWQ